MSPYQRIFSTNTVLSVWRNLRHNRDNNDLLLTFQYQSDSSKGQKVNNHAKGNVTEQDGPDGKSLDATGKSIGFVVPWRSMQAQRKELKEKEKELAEALVVLAGEIAFSGKADCTYIRRDKILTTCPELSPTLQSSLTQNPLVQIRHLAAGLSRQMSKMEMQMFDNAPYSVGKNLYTGGEIAQKFLPTIQTLFHQQPVPYRMIFELLLELKDLIYQGMAGCSKEILEWDINGETISALEELDEAFGKAIIPTQQTIQDTELPQSSHSQKQPFQPKTSTTSLRPQLSFLATDNLLFTLESLETTALALTHLPIPIPDFCAHTVITLRRIVPRQDLAAFLQAKKHRTTTCAEYARCMKWAGTAWRETGGCKRGCKNEDEDAENMPSWHRSSKWYDEKGSGTFMVGGGRVGGGEQSGFAIAGR